MGTARVESVAALGARLGFARAARRRLLAASLGNQKRHMSLYLHAVYGEREAGFREEYARRR